MGREASVRGVLWGVAVLLQACAAGPVASGGLMSATEWRAGGTPGVRRSSSWCPA